MKVIMDLTYKDIRLLYICLNHRGIGSHFYHHMLKQLKDNNIPRKHQQKVEDKIQDVIEEIVLQNNIKII